MQSLVYCYMVLSAGADLAERARSYMVLSLATYRGLGRRAWTIRSGLTLWCSIYTAGRKSHWWISIEEAPTDSHDHATGFGCTPELDSVEVPDILRAIQLRSQV